MVKQANSKAVLYAAGNRRLHILTSTKNYSLRIELEDFEGNTRYASYSHFAVGSEEDGFRLSLSGYSGTAGWCVWQLGTERRRMPPRSFIKFSYLQ